MLYASPTHLPHHPQYHLWLTLPTPLTKNPSHISPMFEKLTLKKHIYRFARIHVWTILYVRVNTQVYGHTSTQWAISGHCAAVLVVFASFLIHVFLFYCQGVLKACVLLNICQNTYKGFQKNNVAAAFSATSQGKVACKGWSFVWMRFSRVWMRSSRGWTRSNRVVRASGCQCPRRKSPGFDPRILRQSGVWGAADEAVLNEKKNPKNSPFRSFRS